MLEDGFVQYQILTRRNAVTLFIHKTLLVRRNWILWGPEEFVADSHEEF